MGGKADVLAPELLHGFNLLITNRYNWIQWHLLLKAQCARVGREKRREKERERERQKGGPDSTVDSQEHPVLNIC